MRRECTDENIKKLQDNLFLIRSAGGWSAEKFGEMIGVTKQTIGNLEKGTVALSKTQYIAIRSVLDYEIDERTKNDPDDCLATTVDICLNSEDVPSEKLALVSSVVCGREKSKLTNQMIKAGLAAILGAAVITSLGKATPNDWLGSILGRNKR